MRKGNNCGILSDDGFVCAIDLGADYCSEHEWGIDEIKHSFGISDDPKVVGIDRRRISKIPETFQLIETSEHCTLFFGRYPSSPPSDSELQSYGRHDRETYTAWAEGDFAVRVYSDSPNHVRNKEILKEFYTAFQEKRIAIWIGGGQVFQNGGLILAIIDRCNPELLQKMKENDIENNRLRDVADKINNDLQLEKRLKSAGKHWFALSPRFHYGSGDWKDHTSFEVIYWLNPRDQHHNRFGWVTVEDLIAWSNNKGSIVEGLSCQGFADCVSYHAQKGVFGKKNA